jgi:transaldolase
LADNLLIAKAESKIAEVSFIKEEPKFRWELLQDSMAFDKLHEGIKKFAEDGATLKALLKKKIQEKTANKA